MVTGHHPAGDRIVVNGGNRLLVDAIQHELSARTVGQTPCEAVARGAAAHAALVGTRVTTAHSVGVLSSPICVEVTRVVCKGGRPVSDRDAAGRYFKRTEQVLRKVVHDQTNLPSSGLLCTPIPGRAPGFRLGKGRSINIWQGCVRESGVKCLKCASCLIGALS